MNIHEYLYGWNKREIITNNFNHKYPSTKWDNYSDMQNPKQDLPQLSTPKIISCI